MYAQYLHIDVDIDIDIDAIINIYLQRFSSHNILPAKNRRRKKKQIKNINYFLGIGSDSGISIAI